MTNKEFLIKLFIWLIVLVYNLFILQAIDRLNILTKIESYIFYFFTGLAIGMQASFFSFLIHLQHKKYKEHV